jgi:hypothetical protein
MSCRHDAALSCRLTACDELLDGHVALSNQHFPREDRCGHILGSESIDLLGKNRSQALKLCQTDAAPAMRKLLRKGFAATLNGARRLTLREASGSAFRHLP